MTQQRPRRLLQKPSSQHRSSKHVLNRQHSRSPISTTSNDRADLRDRNNPHILIDWRCVLPRLRRRAANPGDVRPTTYVSSTGAPPNGCTSARASRRQPDTETATLLETKSETSELMQTSTSIQHAVTVNRSQLALLGTAIIALVWSYWPTLAVLANRWSIDPQYSHGFIVPLVAIGLIWFRRDVLADRELSPSWLGLPLIGLAIGMRLAGARFYFEALDWLSLLPSVAGVCLLIGGWTAWRCAWPGILFLSFMLPLPYRVETMLGGPLQSVATLASTFSLQTLGFPAIAEGNLIRIDETTIGVAEACSGLRMLVVFFAVSTAVAIVVDRTIWERALIIGSAIPVAILCNVVRITLTGVLFETVGNAWAKLVFHDFAGWLMMILALAALRVELWLLDHVLIDPPPREVIPVLSQRSLDDSPASIPVSNSAATTAAHQTSDPVEEPVEEIAAV